MNGWAAWQEDGWPPPAWRARWLPFLLAVSLLPGLGCAGPPARSPAPGPTREDVRAAVREEMRSPEVQRVIEAEVQRQGLQARIEEFLRSAAGEALVERQVERSMSSPDFRRRLGEEVQALARSHDVRTSVEQVVRESVVRLLQTMLAAAAGAGGVAGGAGAGGGAGASGGGGGGGASSGGGGAGGGAGAGGGPS